jgi:hypothetical protein
MDDVESRLAALEKSNRRWRAGCIVLLSLLGLGVLLAAERSPAPPAILQARRIEVLDAKGKAVITLQASDEASTIAVEGPDHEHTAVIVAKAKSASLMLLKNKEAVEVFAEAGNEGGQLGVTNGRGGVRTDPERASVNLVGSDAGFSLFHVVDGRPQSRLSFNSAGGGLELRTPGSKAGARVVGSDKGSRVEILDPTGKSVWSAPEMSK